MSCFSTTRPPSAPKDPRKRVRYSHGLVLGVDDFEQEQAFLIARHRLHHRGLHGYGTFCGLQIMVRTSSEGPEVVVTPGLAVNPAGETIAVPAAQCAKLNAWLAEHGDDLSDAFGSPPAQVSLEIVLCAIECDTDLVPVPGGPCRSQEDSRVASRIASDFRLDLEVARSDNGSGLAQAEELAVRLLVDFLRSIELVSAGASVTPAELAELTRALGEASPPQSPIRVHVDDADAALHLALLTWVTEVRPRSLANGCLGAVDGACVSLGHLQLALQADGTVTVGDVEIDASQRPFLLSARVVQELGLLPFAGGGTLWASPGPGRSLPAMERPASGEPLVVAMGRFAADGSPLGPVYPANLRVERLAATPTDYRITFKPYVNPDAGPRPAVTYMVKATIEDKSGAPPAAFQVYQFQTNAIRVRICDAKGNPVDRAFALEVSAIGRGVGR
jgi:hypothetical protein